MPESSLNLPCLKPDGLSIFTTTADQRLAFGTAIFLNTHYPMSLKRFLPNGKTATLNEDDVLRQLLHIPQNLHGNRVIILYGAAGVGKSELMAWLTIHLQSSDRPIARVSRNDLDVLSTLEKFRHWLTGDYFTEATHQRWVQMR